MRIYIISSYPTEDCGISKYTKELIDGLVAAQVDVLSRRIFFYREKLTLFLWFNFIYEALVLKPEIIHIQYTPTICGPFIPLFLLLVRILGTSKIIVTAHEEPETYLRYCPGITSLFFLLYEKFVYKLSHQILVHTSHHREGLKERYQLEEKRIRVVAHGVSKSEVGSEQIKKVKKKYNPEAKDIITFFGFLRPNKGIEYLLSSFSKVVKRRKSIILVVAGSTIKVWSEYPSRLKQLVKSLKMENHVNFTGFVPNDEVAALFMISKVIVMPYLRSTQSGVLHQAVSCTTPVIVSDVGEIGNFVKKNNVGLVVPPKDVKSLTKAILQLLGNERKQEVFRENELKLGETLSWDNIARLHIQIYKSV